MIRAEQSCRTAGNTRSSDSDRVTTASTVPGMNRPPLLAAVAALALCVAGCGGDDRFGNTAAPAPPATTPPARTVEPSPTPTAAAVHALGDTVALDGATVTVLRYKGAGQLDGDRMGAVEVKTCNTTDTAYEVSTTPWSFVFADDTVSDSSQAWSGVTTPEYPFNPRQLRPGKCVRGWMTFTLSGGKRPAYVEYAPGGLPGRPTPEPVTWRVGS